MATEKATKKALRVRRTDEELLNISRLPAETICSMDWSKREFDRMLGRCSPEKRDQVFACMDQLIKQDEVQLARLKAELKAARQELRLAEEEVRKLSQNVAQSAVQ